MENSRDKFSLIQTEGAPQAIGPYSQGILCAPFIFVSGQLPLSPKTGKLVEGGIREWTTQAIDNIEAILRAAGSDLSRVVRVEVFLTDFKDWGEFNQVYSERFTKPYPARQAVQVSALPMNAPIEISCISR